MTASDARRAMRALLRAAAVTAVALALTASVGNASSICGYNTVVYGTPVVDTAYVAWDCAWWTCFAFSVWPYVESNGEAGLQRGGESITFGDADICQDSPNPDLLVI